MRSRLGLGLAAVLCVGVAAMSRTAAAHPITVDGLTTDWFVRVPNADNLGIVARNMAEQGEYVWLDNTGDARTDLATPENDADITRVQYTATPMGLGILVRLASLVPTGAPVQVQVAIDLDRVAGAAGGQEFFAGLGDTRVADAARWEFLVQTQFGTAAGNARVLNTSFASVGSVTAARSATGGVVEMFVPWSTLGLTAPPAAPLRFTVATFRERTDMSGDTIDIGGSAVSNALDVVSDYGDPRAASPYPNTFAEVDDQVVNYHADVWFNAMGEVYAPLLVTRFVANAANDTTAGGEWVAVRNTTPAMLPLAGFKLGDEETPDGTGEGMYTFPAGATLAPGATYIVAQSGTNYTAVYGRAPDAEFAATSATVPDMANFMPWTASTNWGLANGGDEILALDPSNTVVDVVTFGANIYLGVITNPTVPGSRQVLARVAGLPDRDDNLLDFASGGTSCGTDMDCGGMGCRACVLNTCENRPMGTLCDDGNVCNGIESCNAAGMCVMGPVPADAGMCVDGGGAEDAGSDAGVDDGGVVDGGGVEGGVVDAGPDAAFDAGSDAEVDASVDAGVDATADVGTDAGVDATADVTGDIVAVDMGADAGVDVVVPDVPVSDAIGGDATADAVAEAGDAAADAGVDATADAVMPPPDAAGPDAMADAAPRPDTGGGGRDAALDGDDGGLSITGGGACACSTAGAPAGGRQRTAALGVGLVVMALAASRRRRRRASRDGAASAPHSPQ